MYHLTTILTGETKRKMQEIARCLGYNPKRFARQVIERAVDALYREIKSQEGKQE